MSLIRDLLSCICFFVLYFFQSFGISDEDTGTIQLHNNSFYNFHKVFVQLLSYKMPGWRTMAFFLVFYMIWFDSYWLWNYELDLYIINFVFYHVLHPNLHQGQILNLLPLLKLIYMLYIVDNKGSLNTSANW